VPEKRDHQGDNARLWIECPDCQGCGGWYGCENCGAVLSRDEPPVRTRCDDCQRAFDCVAGGGHHWGPVFSTGAGERYAKACPCGVRESLRRDQIEWSPATRGYVEVAK
jgi:hypothetical protein